MSTIVLVVSYQTCWLFQIAYLRELDPFLLQFSILPEQTDSNVTQSLKKISKIYVNFCNSYFLCFKDLVYFMFVCKLSLSIFHLKDYFDGQVPKLRKYDEIQNFIIFTLLFFLLFNRLKKFTLIEITFYEILTEAVKTDH